MVVLLFDFVGCGNSTGNHLTLGVNEAIDLAEILLHMYKKYTYDEIYLWGRSMGAVCIINMLKNTKDQIDDLIKKQEKLIRYKKLLLKANGLKKDLMDKISFLEKDIYKMRHIQVIDKIVKGLVLDSPFTTASKMIKTAIKLYADTNSLTTTVLMQFLKYSIKKNIGEEIIDLNRPKDLVSDLNYPAVFLIGEKDELISQKSFIKMFNSYGSDNKKMRLLIDTDHSDERSQEDIYFGVKFIKRLCAELKEQQRIDTDEHVIKNYDGNQEEDKVEVVGRIVGALRKKVL